MKAILYGSIFPVSRNRENNKILLNTSEIKDTVLTLCINSHENERKHLKLRFISLKNSSLGKVFNTPTPFNSPMENYEKKYFSIHHH